MNTDTTPTSEEIIADVNTLVEAARLGASLDAVFGSPGGVSTETTGKLLAIIDALALLPRKR